MKKRDLILIGSILAIIIVSFVAVNIVKQDGAYVVVRVDGAEVAKYSLDKDGEYEINGGSNVLKIENGEAWMSEADCPTLGNTRCTAQRKISYTTQWIWCQYNKVLLTIEGDGAEQNSDGIEIEMG